MSEQPTTTGRMMLLPPHPDACQVCAVKHEPEQPHNPQSLYWQVARQMDGLPPPTWADALAHVTPELRAAWVTALAGHGVIVGDTAGASVATPPAGWRPSNAEVVTMRKRSRRKR